MTIPIPEPIDQRMHTMVTKTMKLQVEEEAKKRNTSEANIVRYILSLYFAGDFGETKENHRCCQRETAL